MRHLALGLALVVGGLSLLQAARAAEPSEPAADFIFCVGLAVLPAAAADESRSRIAERIEAAMDGVCEDAYEAYEREWVRHVKRKGGWDSLKARVPREVRDHIETRLTDLLAGQLGL